MKTIVHQDYGLHRAPPSPQIYGTLEASETDASSDEEDEEALRVMNEGEGNFHDAANDLQEEGDEYTERALSGTLSESSGNLGSDVFDYKVRYLSTSVLTEHCLGQSNVFVLF